MGTVGAKSKRELCDGASAYKVEIVACKNGSRYGIPQRSVGSLARVDNDYRV